MIWSGKHQQQQQQQEKRKKEKEKEKERDNKAISKLQILEYVTINMISLY